MLLEASGVLPSDSAGAPSLPVASGEELAELCFSLITLVSLPCLDGQKNVSHRFFVYQTAAKIKAPAAAPPQMMPATTPLEMPGLC